MSEIHKYDPHATNACDVTKVDGDVTHICRLPTGHQTGYAGAQEVTENSKLHACGCCELWTSPPGEHHTLADTMPHEDHPGGAWVVTCTCSWRKDGAYARTNRIAEAVALRLANAYGKQHEDAERGPA